MNMIFRAKPLSLSGNTVDSFPSNESLESYSGQPWFDGFQSCMGPALSHGPRSKIVNRLDSVSWALNYQESNLDTTSYAEL